jgi:GntR family transcriptional repressor for pyruvate dehydrogenase complex
MVLDPLEARGVTSIVQEQLEERILSGELATGHKLPSEQDLAKQANVGRRAIRDALKALEMKGLVITRRGSGTFVMRNDYDHFMQTMIRNIHAYLDLDRVKLAQVVQFREFLEGGIIADLATHCREDAMAMLDETLERQMTAHQKGDLQAYNVAHYDFHIAITDSTANPLVRMVYRQLISILQPYMRVSVNRLAFMHGAISEHKQIVEAIRSGDPVAAQACFRTHMKSSFAHLSDLVEMEVPTESAS